MNHLFNPPFSETSIEPPNVRYRRALLATLPLDSQARKSHTPIVGMTAVATEIPKHQNLGITSEGSPLA